VRPDEARTAVAHVLGQIAPEADIDTVPADADLTEELDLDSMDFLNFVIALHKATGVNVPETDYTQIASLDAAVAYLRARV
jgi:acyl carrier protein